VVYLYCRAKSRSPVRFIFLVAFNCFASINAPLDSMKFSARDEPQGDDKVQPDRESRCKETPTARRYRTTVEIFIRCNVAAIRAGLRRG
jgi:hypothetical protein